MIEPRKKSELVDQVAKDPSTGLFVSFGPRASKRELGTWKFGIAVDEPLPIVQRLQVGHRPSLPELVSAVRPRKQALDLP